jgi:hypothetical protein
MSETSFKIKCSKSSSARRFSLSKPTLAALSSHVEASWGASGPSFWYVDDDGDRINVKNEHELGAAIAGMRDHCVSLNVDFHLSPERGAVAPLVSAGSPSSDDEDGFISVVLDSDAATGRAALVDSNAEDLPDPSAAQAKSVMMLAEQSTMQQPARELQLEQTCDVMLGEDTAPLGALRLPRVKVLGDETASRGSLARIGVPSHFLKHHDALFAELAGEISDNWQEVQTLKNTLQSTRAQAASDAACARLMLRQTMEMAEERFEAATSVLKLQLREAQAALAAAQRQNVDAFDSAQAGRQLQDASACHREVQGEQGLRASPDAQQQELEGLEKEREFADLFDALSTACSENQALVDENAALERRLQLAGEAMQGIRSQAEAEAARAAAEHSQLRAEVEKWRKEAESAGRIAEAWKVGLPEAAERANARSSSLPAHALPGVHPPAVSARCTGGGGAPPDLSSPLPLPRNSNHSNWLRVAQTVGAPLPSSSDIEQFERAMAVLRSMSLDVGDDARRCVVVNNGSVQQVVDQMLASVA